MRSPSNPAHFNAPATARPVHQSRTHGAARTQTATQRTAAQPLDEARTMAQLERLARLMDEAYQIPGTRYRVGLDAIIGLVPVVGDAISLATNAYVIYIADRLGVSRLTLARMLLNAGADFALGSVPLAGDLFDAAFKSHRRNLDLLRSALNRRDALVR